PDPRDRAGSAPGRRAGPRTRGSASGCPRTGARPRRSDRCRTASPPAPPGLRAGPGCRDPRRGPLRAPPGRRARRSRRPRRAPARPLRRRRWRGPRPPRSTPEGRTAGGRSRSAGVGSACCSMSWPLPLESTRRNRAYSTPAAGGSGAGDMTESRTDGEAAAVKALLALLLAGALVPIWIAPLPPLQDLPNHLLKVDILRRWMHGEPEVRAIYALNLKLLANYTCYAVLLLLAPFFSLVTAARILLSMIVVGLPLSAYALLRRVNPENTLLALAVPALNFNLFLMMGNLNFCLALALLLLALRIFVAEGGRAGRSHLCFAVAATVLYFTHGFVFLI